MGFSDPVKREALVRSNRRCCVCHRHNGVGVEAHHIKQQADGGPDTIDNAIVLCFDCHAAAGHYNSKHPRGTKYSPQELKRHKEEWWKRVETAGISDLEPEILPDHNIRHLLCMDNEAAKELLEMDGVNFPFTYDYLEENEVAKFMRHVLEDELPFTWARSATPEGNFWGKSKQYESIEAFNEGEPEFKNNETRALLASDFCESRIPSKILKQCFKEGLDEELSTKDNELGRVYDGLVASFNSKQDVRDLKKHQNIWLRERERCSTELNFSKRVDCIGSSYLERVRSLQNM